MPRIPTAGQREELGAFIRACRDRLTPADVGLPPGTRRRAPGLRREEVAQLCGMSTTWYTWIEQGREVSASPHALARLAGALRLGRAERAYLFDLAGRRDPDPDAATNDDVPPAVLASLETITAPAYVLDRRWTARGWNAAAERLFAGWLDRPGDRNLLRFIFLEPAARDLISDWETRARRVAAEFRAAAGAHVNDTDLRDLVSDLRAESPDFARLWTAHGVLEREGGERAFTHPSDGPLRFTQATFEIAGHHDLRLTILVPQGS